MKTSSLSTANLLKERLGGLGAFPPGPQQHGIPEAGLVEVGVIQGRIGEISPVECDAEEIGIRQDGTA